MKIRELREKMHMSRKELSDKTGISFRSLQDYEQGHKDIKSAKAITIYKISVALGCTMEELIEIETPKVEQHLKEERIRTYGKTATDYIYHYNEEDVKDGILFSVEKNADRRVYEQQKRLLKYAFELTQIYYEPKKVTARWKFVEESCFLEFVYDGEIVRLPFIAVFSYEVEKWLVQAALLKIESYIEEREFQKKAADLWKEQSNGK